jgi:hypothetical protein
MDANTTPQLDGTGFSTFSPITDPSLKVANSTKKPSEDRTTNGHQLKTKDADGNDFRENPDEDVPSSVIHAPKGFELFVSTRPSKNTKEDRLLISIAF